MEVQTSLANEIDSTPSDSSTLYDQKIKELLANIPVLAIILKECVEEFKNVDLEDIKNKWIEPDKVKISSCRNSKIDGKTTEDISISGQPIYYDILFDACAPTSDGLVKIIVNIEPQNDFYPSYSLTKRAIYYCCRLISSQKGREFEHSDYNGIKKVYSIWICTTPSVAKQDSISRYRIIEDTVVGNVDEESKNYDLIEVLMVRLCKNPNKARSKIVYFLSTLLSTNLKPDQKKKILKDKFNIQITEKLGKEIDEMCNLSVGVREEGILEGFNKGKIEGRIEAIAEGKADGRTEDIATIMQNTGFSIENVMSLMNISKSEYDYYRKRVDEYLHKSEDNFKS